MAAILTGYNLALGETRTLQINAPSYINLQVLLGVVSGRVKFVAQKKQSTGDWIDLKNDRNEVIQFQTSNEIENGIDLDLVGASSYSFKVIPIGVVTGTLTVDALTDGTIA